MPGPTNFDLYIIEVVDRVLPPELAGLLRMVILGSPPPQPAPEGITHRRAGEINIFYRLEEAKLVVVLVTSALW
ncbi:hypothetical protein QE152_g29904 [Popillia japonica]|uniref:Type II toxin-antitoxin system RelE/ParE family toxin n=1 Tax=Popillia japonica TaxID=7064 RepID=A0AAW1JHC2_POPJA